jgi:hypothetical protein
MTFDRLHLWHEQRSVGLSARKSLYPAGRRRWRVLRRLPGAPKPRRQRLPAPHRSPRPGTTDGRSGRSRDLHHLRARALASNKVTPRRTYCRRRDHRAGSSVAHRSAATSARCSTNASPSARSRRSTAIACASPRSSARHATRRRPPPICSSTSAPGAQGRGSRARTASGSAGVRRSTWGRCLGPCPDGSSEAWCGPVVICRIASTSCVISWCASLRAALNSDGSFRTETGRLEMRRGAGSPEAIPLGPTRKSNKIKTMRAHWASETAG